MADTQRIRPDLPSWEETHVSVQDLMLDHLKELQSPVKRVLLEAIVAEQEQMDLARPQGLKARIKEVIEREASVESPR